MQNAARLSYPAPRRVWSWTGEGFSSHRWTVEDVKSAREGGAWFAKATHDFASREAAIAAGGGSDE